MLTREQILGANDIVIETVNVPEWGGDVCVKGLDGAGRGMVEASSVQVKGKDTNVNMINLRERIAVATVCDENGNLLFTKSDIAALGKKSAAALDRVVKVAYRLSGIGEDVVSELTEGLENDPTVGSASD